MGVSATSHHRRITAEAAGAMVCSQSDRRFGHWPTGSSDRRSTTASPPRPCPPGRTAARSTAPPRRRRIWSWPVAARGPRRALQQRWLVAWYLRDRRSRPRVDDHGTVKSHHQADRRGGQPSPGLTRLTPGTGGYRGRIEPIDAAGRAISPRGRVQVTKPTVRGVVKFTWMSPVFIRTTVPGQPGRWEAGAAQR